MNHREFHQLVLDTVPECTESSPEFFFADPYDDEEPGGRSEQALAVGICNRCPIKGECFTFALENEIEEGIWGGFLPQQRQAYARRKTEKAVGED